MPINRVSGATRILAPWSLHIDHPCKLMLGAVKRPAIALDAEVRMRLAACRWVNHKMRRKVAIPSERSGQSHLLRYTSILIHSEV